MRDHRQCLATAAALVLLVALLSGCAADRTATRPIRDVTVFYAACFSSMIDALSRDAEETLGIRLRTEISGSQVVCRKVTELHRECDLMMVADSTLLKRIASSHVSWRIDFARDEIVLGIGIRAPMADQVASDWPNVLTDESVRLGRVDESLGPIGYRTLMVWTLQEAAGHPGLVERLKGRTVRLADHVMTLATQLKAGDVDYGFLYRSTCIAHDIRFVPLSESINLGSPDADYSAAEVKVRLHRVNADDQSPEGLEELVGMPIVYSLSIPSSAVAREEAFRLVRHLLSNPPRQTELLLIEPRFYGSQEDYVKLAEVAEYRGDL